MTTALPHIFGMIASKGGIIRYVADEDEARSR